MPGTPPRIALQMAPIGLLAFVQSERLSSSPDAPNERWMPFVGPHAADDPRIRFSVFSWNYVDQTWERGLSFADAEEAGGHAIATHNFLMLKWGEGVPPTQA